MFPTLQRRALFDARLQCRGAVEMRASSRMHDADAGLLRRDDNVRQRPAEKMAGERERKNFGFGSGCAEDDLSPLAT